MLNKLQPPAQDNGVNGNASYLAVAVPTGVAFETHNARPETFDYVCLVLLLLTAACFGAVLGFVYGKKHSTAD